MKTQPVTMTENIGGPISPFELKGPTEAPSDTTFANVLGDFVSQTAALDAAGRERMQGLASGLTDDLHGTMIAAKEAEISVKLLGNVKNKLLDAFHELWRTNV